MPSSSARKSMNSEMLRQRIAQGAEMNKCKPEEPAFLDDDGPSDDLPPIFTTTNIRELYGWQPGESLDEAMARHLAERDLPKAGN